jgi:iron complex outermembrane receptor protein
MKKDVRLATAVAMALVSAGAAAQSAAPNADEGLEEVVVTAQKREQNLQDVPVAITAFSAAALEEKGIAKVEDLTKIAPSLTITRATTAPSSSINLRGIGTFAFSTGVEPSVAVVVDDLALLQQAQAFSNLSDVARVEVLRGPQGTLFGKGASAGVINIVSQPTTPDLTGAVTASATSDDQYRLEGTVSGPLSDTVGFRVSAFGSSEGGYLPNLATGHELGAEHSWGVRARLGVQASESVRVDFMADHAETRGNGLSRPFRAVPAGATAFGAPIAPNLVGIVPGAGNDSARVNIDPSIDNKLTLGSVKVTVDLGAVSLLSISGYQKWSFDFTEDVDGTATPAFGVPGGIVQSGPYSSHLFSQELRLVSNGTGPFTYLGGVFYADGRTERGFRRGPGSPLAANWFAKNGTTTYAAFGQFTYDFAPAAHVDVGLRYNREKIDVDFQNLLVPATPPANNATCLANCVADASDDQVTGKIALRYDLADDVMAFVSFATGYKGQGFDISSGFTPARLKPVNAEHSKAYEFGLKSRLLDNRLELNATAFLTDYEDFQAQSAISLPSGALQFTLSNVGQLRTKGLELELAARPVPALRIDASAAYVDAKVQSYPRANCYSGQTAALGCVGGFQNLAGARLSNSPKTKVSIGANYDIALASSFDAFVGADYRHQSSVQFDLLQNPAAIQGGYGVLNARVGLRSRSGRYTLTLFADNVADKQYVANILAANGGSPGLVNQVIPRSAFRLFGLRLGAQF